LSFRAREKGLDLPKPAWTSPTIFSPSTDYIRKDIEDFPEVGQVEVVRHFTRLSSLTIPWTTAFIPWAPHHEAQPKINEAAARIDHSRTHRRSRSNYVQGCLELMWNLEAALKALTGLDRVNPSARRSAPRGN